SGAFTYTSSNASVATISGNTVTVVGQGTATITATQAAAGLYLQTPKTFTLTVTLPAPSGLSYTTPNTFTVGTAITPLSPSVTGTVTNYSVSPGLPAGLILNSSTGVISGTPSAVNPATDYTVTATNSAGATTAVVSIAFIIVNLKIYTDNGKLIINSEPSPSSLSKSNFPPCPFTTIS
ncbi:MAG: hypothetical protein EOP45_17990, partial [Sphingobacteriaceae bacterium]